MRRLRKVQKDGSTEGQKDGEGGVKNDEMGEIFKKYFVTLQK